MTYLVRSTAYSIVEAVGTSLPIPQGVDTMLNASDKPPMLLGSLSSDNAVPQSQTSSTHSEYNRTPRLHSNVPLYQ